MTISATETCNLDTPPDLSGATLRVEGELIIDFVEELVVDTLIVDTTGRISANGKGFSVGDGRGGGTADGSGGKPISFSV